MQGVRVAAQGGNCNPILTLKAKDGELDEAETLDRPPVVLLTATSSLPAAASPVGRKLSRDRL